MRRGVFALVLSAVGGVVLCGSANASPTPALAVVSTGDRTVKLFDPFDGSLLNSSFIELNPLGAGTPIHAMMVGNEVWVSDQLRDRIDRFDQGGNFLSTIGGEVPGGGLDNIRGMRVVGNEVWVTNAGSNNNAPGNALVRLDLNGNIVGNVPVNGSTWFIEHFDGDLLVSYSGSGVNSRIERFTTGGVLVGDFNTPGELNFIQQLHATSVGTVLASQFSGGTNSGVYEYDANGVNLGVIAGTQPFGPRGVWELGNGNIMWTNGSGVWVTDPSDGSSTQVLAGQFRYIDSVVIPAPGVAGLLGLAGLFASRRRR